MFSIYHISSNLDERKITIKPTRKSCYLYEAWKKLLRNGMIDDYVSSEYYVRELTM